MANIADDSLSTGVDVNILDCYVLLTLAPFPRQGFDLHGEGTHEFGCQVAKHIQPFDAVPLIWMACDHVTSAGDQFKQCNTPTEKAALAKTLCCGATSRRILEMLRTLGARPPPLTLTGSRGAYF